MLSLLLLLSFLILREPGISSVKLTRFWESVGPALFNSLRCLSSHTFRCLKRWLGRAVNLIIDCHRCVVFVRRARGAQNFSGTCMPSREPKRPPGLVEARYNSKNCCVCATSLSLNLEPLTQLGSESTQARERVLRDPVPPPLPSRPPPL